MSDEKAEQPLLSTPLREIEIDQVEQRYLTRVRFYLEQELQCCMIYVRERATYLIQFPEGTVEETYRGQSTPWTYRTNLRLPGGTTLQKYVTAPLNPMQRGRTMLAFPTRILESPASGRSKGQHGQGRQKKPSSL